jgi:hypothetical protein
VGDGRTFAQVVRGIMNQERGQEQSFGGLRHGGNLMRNSVDGRQEQERYIHRSCGNFGGSNSMGGVPRFDNFLGSQSH